MRNLSLEYILNFVGFQEILYSSMEEVDFVLKRKALFDVHVCLKKAFGLRFEVLLHFYPFDLGLFRIWLSVFVPMA
jgi:hypothetical protein